MNEAAQNAFKVGKLELLVVSGVISFYSFLIFYWALFRGAIGVARNDDWVYLHMAQWFADSGEFRVESGSMANALGLVLLGQPSIILFGYSIETLQILEIFVGAIGLFATWFLLRTFLNKWLSFLGIATLVASPFWISTSVSFMTDVPAYTLQLIALLIAVRAYKAHRYGFNWLFVAYLFCFAAFSVREYSIASGLAITAFYLFSKSASVKKLRLKAVALASLWMVSCIALYLWRSDLENAAEFRGVFEIGVFKESSIQALRAICMLGFLLIPALLLASPTKKIKQLNLLQNIVALLPSTLFAIVMFLLFRQRGLVFGNYFTPQGSYVETFPLGIAPNVISAPVFDLLTWLGVVALAYLLWLGTLWISCIDRESNSRNESSTIGTTYEQVGLVGWFVFGMLGTLIFVPLITNAPLFDRYFLPVIPCLTALVLYFIQNFQFTWAAGNVLSALALAALTFLSSVFIDSSFILDGLKWKVGNYLVTEGYSPGTIDAGYEWFGYHQTEVAHGQQLPPIRNWWTRLYDSPQICASVGIGIVDKEINETLITKRYEVSNFIGTDFVVWSVNSIPPCK